MTRRAPARRVNYSTRVYVMRQGCQQIGNIRSVFWTMWEFCTDESMVWRARWARNHHGAKHSLKQKCLGGLRPFEDEKLPDPQKWTLDLYNYIKYVEARAFAKITFERILDLFTILFWDSNSKYLSVSKSRLRSST